MELIDITGPGYPCSICGSTKEICSYSSSHHFSPVPVDQVLDLTKVLCSPLQDIASRLKAL